MNNTLPSSRIGLLRSVSFLWSTNHEHNVTPKAHRKFYDRLFTFGTTLSKLRDSTLAERLYLTPTDTVSVAGRSLAWKVSLLMQWNQSFFSTDYLFSTAFFCKRRTSPSIVTASSCYPVRFNPWLQNDICGFTCGENTSTWCHPCQDELAQCQNFFWKWSW